MKRVWSLAAAFAGLAAVVWWRRGVRPLSVQDLAAAWTVPLPPPDGPLKTFHLGHSLVGRDMPAMLAQLAGHGYASQLGWGASLKQHWVPGEVIPGFAVENDHPAFRHAHEALGSGEFDAVVLTELVEIRDAVAFHESGLYLAHWARAARAVNPAARVYLYETWHRLDDPAGWLNRLDGDLARHWEGDLIRPAMARDHVGVIHVIPAGQVLARLVRAIDAGQVPGLTQRSDLFARTADGAADMIHLSDVGAYLVALVHFAVMYQRNPLGLPHEVLTGDGRAVKIGAPTAQVMQQVVWEVVTGYRGTGVGLS